MRANRAATSQKHPRQASTRATASSRSALRAIGKSDGNQPSRSEVSQQTVEPRGRVRGADIVLGNQAAQDLRERSRRLNQIPDACADVREPVVHTVAQAENHDLFAQACGQLIRSGDDGGVGRERIDHGGSVSHESAARWPGISA